MVHDTNQRHFKALRRSVIAAAFALSYLLVPVGCRSRLDYVREADRDAYCLIQQKSRGTPWQPDRNFNILPACESRLVPDGTLTRPCLPSPTTSLYAYNLPLLRSASKPLEDDGEQGEQEESEQPLGRPIPPDAWSAIPAACLDRMVDFDSIRDEAAYTESEYSIDVLANERGDAPKLTLEDVVDLAILNSRAYQTQKETLYLFALQLSQERFNYRLNPLRRGNGSALDFLHRRSGGITENSLSIPSGIGYSQALATGGDFLATFANNILLTFNGPAGFSKSVSSRLLLNYTQPLIQRDIQFESLTQAERNLVYAARDFARFRKQFFVSFASDYYSLIRSFRLIEIDSQNYFSLVRAFNQAEQEFLANQVPRFQVDQVEQNLLSGRGRLIATCNSVEQALDSLKLDLGIPTETNINVDLGELNKLTRLDRLSVAADSANRVISRLETNLKRPDREELLSTSAVLIDRLINAIELQEASGENSLLLSLTEQRQLTLIDYARLVSQQELSRLESKSESADMLSDIERMFPNADQSTTEERLSTSLMVQRYKRLLAYDKSLIALVERQLDYAFFLVDTRSAEDVSASAAPLPPGGDAISSRKNSTELTSDEVAEIDNRKQQFAIQTTRLDEDLATLTKEGSAVQVAELVERAQQLRTELESFVDAVDRRLDLEKVDDAEADLNRIIDDSTSLVSRARATIGAAEFGLKPIDIGTDDAMLTALVLRFDLMNQREALADNWRQIKLAADDLKAILDINATQIISTDSNTNAPFNFTFDDSSTSLGMTFDAPLNRFIERNNFRATLIDYHRELRTMTQLEDNIKFAIRNDLRNLTLDREQYLIAVASAALAYERVVSTSLEFRLGTGGVTARDFLEAQTAYTDALSNVASRHIDYITDRAQLFLDLELLYVDEDGFWDDIRNEQLQPEPVYSLPPWSYPVYGKLPCVCYSDEITQGMCVPVVGPDFPEFMPEIEVPPEWIESAEQVEALEQMPEAYPLHSDSVHSDSVHSTLSDLEVQSLPAMAAMNPAPELRRQESSALAKPSSTLAEPYTEEISTTVEIVEELTLPFPDAP